MAGVDAVSAYGGILDALLADVATAVSGVTTARTVTPLHLVQQCPFAYAYMAEQRATVLPYGQESASFEAVVVLVTDQETQEAMYTRIDAIKAQVYADRKLGSLVDHVYIETVQLFEEPIPGTRKGAAIVFAVLKDQ